MREKEKSALALPFDSFKKVRGNIYLNWSCVDANEWIHSAGVWTHIRGGACARARRAGVNTSANNGPLLQPARSLSSQDASAPLNHIKEILQQQQFLYKTRTPAVADYFIWARPGCMQLLHQCAFVHRYTQQRRAHNTWFIYIEKVVSQHWRWILYMWLCCFGNCGIFLRSK